MSVALYVGSRGISVAWASAFGLPLPKVRFTILIISEPHNFRLAYLTITMSDNFESSLDNMRKRQQRAKRIWQYIIALLLVAILVVLGIIAYQLLGGDSEAAEGEEGNGLGGLALFTTATHTATFTPSPIPPTNTLPPTETATATVTFTPTRSGPLEYTIQEGDNLFYIADEFEVAIEQLFQFNLEQGIDLATGVILPGQAIFIPPPDYEGPTATPFPTDLEPGSEIVYQVQPGDFLSTIAEKFNTTMDSILEANEDLNADSLQVGQELIIPFNVIALTPVTETATFPPTRTATPEVDATPEADAAADPEDTPEAEATEEG